MWGNCLDQVYFNKDFVINLKRKINFIVFLTYYSDKETVKILFVNKYIPK